MKCPYCLSDLDHRAIVCKYCKHNVALPRQLMLQISQLEQRVKSLQRNPVEDSGLVPKNVETADSQNVRTFPEICRNVLLDFVLFFVVPLCLLLLAHTCITIVYDTKIIYLRIVTLLLPLCFGYLLCRNRSRNILAWIVCVIGLGWTAVIGMSTITSLVDDSPIWPHSIYEWRDMIEFAASISFSYLTGMFLGRIALLKTKITSYVDPSDQMTTAWLVDADQDRPPSASIGMAAKKVSEFTATIGAIVTTVIAIYTGLKGLF